VKLFADDGNDIFGIVVFSHKSPSSSYALRVSLSQPYRTESFILSQVLFG